MISWDNLLICIILRGHMLVSKMYWKMAYLAIYWSVFVCLVPITTISLNLVVWHRFKNLNTVGISQCQTGDMNSTTALNTMRCQAGLPQSTGYFHDSFASTYLRFPTHMAQISPPQQNEVRRQNEDKCHTNSSK